MPKIEPNKSVDANLQLNLSGHRGDFLCSVSVDADLSDLKYAQRCWFFEKKTGDAELINVMRLEVIRVIEETRVHHVSPRKVTDYLKTS